MTNNVVSINGAAGVTALEREYSNVAKAKGKDRGNALFLAASKLVAYISPGGLTQEFIRERLVNACYMNGLMPSERTFIDEQITIAFAAGSTVAGLPSGISTEQDAAEEFVRLYGQDFRYCEERATWFYWTGARWEPVKTSNHWRAVSEFVHQVGVPSLGRARSIDGIVKFVSAHPDVAVTSDVFDLDHLLLGTPGGTVDLRTGELRPAERNDLITQTTAVTPEPGECPEWMRFLAEATGGDLGLQRYLQQIAGYSLTGLTIEQCLFFFYGEGGRGKGTFLNTLSALMADYAATATMETFMDSKYERHSTDIAHLHKARLVTASETKEGRPWDEAKIKNLTGQDKITARFMRQDNFEFIPKFKLCFMGNHQPMLRNVDDSIKRRFNILPFNIPPAKRDNTLMDKLRAEWPQILHWAIQGCLDWQRSGLAKPAIALEATNDYFDENDRMALWMSEAVILDDSSCCLLNDLYNSWKEYCESQGSFPRSIQVFRESLKRHGILVTKDAVRADGMPPGRWARGIRLAKSGTRRVDLQRILHKVGENWR